MTQIRIECFRSGCAQKDCSENPESTRIFHDQVPGVNRIHGFQYRGVLKELNGAEIADEDEPYHHHGSKSFTHDVGSKLLEKENQYENGNDDGNSRYFGIINSKAF